MMIFSMMSLNGAGAGAGLALLFGAALAYDSTTHARLEPVLQGFGGVLLVVGLVLLGTVLPFAG